MWSEVIRFVNEKERFILTTHTNPDLDALGSELALDEYLRSLGKEVSILNSDSVPRILRFIDPERRVRTFSPSRHRRKIQQADVIFVVDASGSWDRVGRIGDVLAVAANRSQDGATVICIDHHPDPVDFAHLAVVNTNAAATAELVFDLITQAGGAITPSIAEWLYLAILTDTGSFRYPKTNPQTHQIAAKLIEAGADPMQLYKRIYEQRPLELVRLKGHVLNSLQVGANGQLVWYALDKSTLKAYDVAAADLEGFPGLGMQIGGVRVSLLCVELPRGRVKVSLRSDGNVAINRLAIQLGGGGHPSAAGAVVEGDLAQVTAQVVADVEALLSSGSHHPQPDGWDHAIGRPGVPGPAGQSRQRDNGNAIPMTFLPNTHIEIIHPHLARGHIRHALFDFDGTLSLIREGWQGVMIPLMVEVLLDAPDHEGEAELTRIVTDFVTRLTGKQTIYQMLQLAEEVRKRGRMPLDPLDYKQEYLRRLWSRIKDRVADLKAGRRSPDDLMVPGARDVLETLRARDVTCYLASGTDRPYVLDEADALGLTPYFGHHIYGALDDYQNFSKRMVIDHILRENHLAGPELVAFGDGFVEIEDTKATDGIAVGVASNEATRQGIDAWKRQRLIQAGADLIIPDFRDHAVLVAYLFPT